MCTLVWRQLLHQTDITLPVVLIRPGHRHGRGWSLPGDDADAARLAQDRKSRGAGEILSTSHNQAPNSHIEK